MAQISGILNVWKFCISDPLNPRPSASEIRDNVTKMFTVLWTGRMPANRSELCLTSSREKTVKLKDTCLF